MTAEASRPSSSLKGVAQQGTAVRTRHAGKAVLELGCLERLGRERVCDDTSGWG